jgi:glycerol kinase
MALQTRDVVDAMAAASGMPLHDLRVDGGAAVMDLLMQCQAEQLGVPVRRPLDQETTALGAAFLAGLAEGVWPSLDAVSDRWQLDAEFRPEGGDAKVIADALHVQWLRAVERSRRWQAH